MKFGEQVLIKYNISLLGRVKFNLFGVFDIGAYSRSLYFINALKLREIRTKFKKEKLLKVLDAGCGDGSYSFYMEERFSNASIDAIDISSESIEENKALAKKLEISNIDFQKFDFYNLKEKNKYDFIICIATMIYRNFEENKKIFINFLESLKSHGVMYLYLTHKNWEEAMIINPKWYKKVYVNYLKQNCGHIYSMNELSGILSKLGYKIIKKKMVYGFWGELAWEIDKIFKECNIERSKIFIFPILKIMCFMDTLINYKKGAGMIFILEKS